MNSVESGAFCEAEMRTICASPLFRGYARHETAALLTRFDARRKAFPDGAVVVNECEAPTRMGVLLAGYLHVYDSAMKGTRHLVRIVRPGEVLGATLVGGVPQQMYPALVTAHGPCVLATLSLVCVDKLIKTGGGVFF